MTTQKAQTQMACTQKLTHARLLTSQSAHPAGTQGREPTQRGGSTRPRLRHHCTGQQRALRRAGKPTSPHWTRRKQGRLVLAQGTQRLGGGRGRWREEGTQRREGAQGTWQQGGTWQRVDGQGTCWRVGTRWQVGSLRQEGRPSHRRHLAQATRSGADSLGTSRGVGWSCTQGRHPGYRRRRQPQGWWAWMCSRGMGGRHWRERCCKQGRCCRRWQGTPVPLATRQMWVAQRPR